MQSLIHKKPIFHFFPHHLPTDFFVSKQFRNLTFLRIHPDNCRYTFKAPTLCSNSPSPSLSYGGWDDYELIDPSANSGESNQLHSFLNSIGIGDKKYVFVYLFGFVCALAFSRVKVSSIIVFPTCAVVFALGFSVGLVKGGNLRELKLNGNRKQLVDENFRGFIEKFRSLGDSLKGYNTKVLSLKNDIRKGIESNQVSVSDLEGYIDVLESSDVSFRNAIDSVESYIQTVLIGKDQDKEGSSGYESSKVDKKVGENGTNFSKYIGGLFGKKFDGPKSSKMKDSGKRELMDVDVNYQKGANILADLNTAPNRNMENMLDSPTDINMKSRTRAEYFIDGNGMENPIGENVKRNVSEKSDANEAAFDQTVYSNWNEESRFVNNQRVHFEENRDEIETMASQNGSYDSVNFRISMNHVKSTASSRRQQNHDRNYTYFERTEDYSRKSLRYSLKNEISTPEKRFFVNQESGDENVSRSSPSPMHGDDLEFNRYLAEANKLLKEAKGSLRQKADDSRTEHALQKATMLLSNAIEMRPMSLLAVGQLGNTYLLHGELKLGISRKLRSRLVRTDPLSVGKWEKMLNDFDDELDNRDKILLALADVCEECEDLLIKAGRKYKLALSIDGNDTRTLYNWGLALSYRAQLIADIGPSAAADADKIFLAAIEKFDAIMSKGNDHAPDALYRWGTALQYRSRLRPRNSREKLKLLQQAKRLYEDALQMDSRNIQLKDAFTSCISELDYWCS